MTHAHSGVIFSASLQCMAQNFQLVQHKGKQNKSMDELMNEQNTYAKLCDAEGFHPITENREHFQSDVGVHHTLSL